MHGRLKVKSTEEQIEAKKKEREKKLLLYNGAMSKIFLKKQNGELDQEMLLLSGEVLVVNPDVYTLWNFRKETFLELSTCLPGEQLQRLYQSELYFLEACLKKNPKSYGSWHHRCFVMDHMPDPDWKRELELCNQFLQLDERNFHCWDYRRFVVHSAKIPPEEEFEFSLRLINNNFSNYSSWHYRSKLLPILFPDATQPMGVSEDALLKEYELVQNGFFTDPDDQSNWFYHRWLMGRGNQTLNINCFYVSREDNCVLVSFTKHIQIGKKTDLILECNEQTMPGTVWLNPNKTSQSSCLWRADNLTFPKDCDLKVTLVQGSLELCSSSLHLGENDSSLSGSSVISMDKSIFSQEMSPLKKDTLLQAMESVLQLMEMESDNKWTVLTVVLLMKALDPDSYFDQIMCYLDKLEDLDGKRIHYYKDLRSKFIIENIFAGTELTNASAITLSGRSLTKMYHTELLPLVTSLDLCDNLLRDVHEFNLLQNVKVLNLANNKLENCEGLQHLPKLERLLLNGNNLTKSSDLLQLTTCAKLNFLDISNNPLSCQEEEIQTITALLPNVSICFKQQ